MSPDIAGSKLAHRLNELRAQHGLTQSQLAKALQVSAPSISSWESAKAPKPPPVERLRAYARLFATERSTEGGKLRVLDEDELTDAERVRANELEQELLSLHPLLRVVAPAAPASSGSWPADDFFRFDEGRVITIVCASVPDKLKARMPYSHASDPDFVKLLTYADLDALLEMYGHLRAVNPHSEVVIRLASEMRGDDYTTHLMALGGVDWNELTRDLFQEVDLPVRQISSYAPGGASFEVVDRGKRRTFSPVFRPDESGGLDVLVEDIAHVYRSANPFNSAATLAICNGIFGRGTYAAVRSLTDPRFRLRNTAYVRQRFGGGPFSMLARARIRSAEALTPDWTVPQVRLHEWPDP